MFERFHGLIIVDEVWNSPQYNAILVRIHDDYYIIRDYVYNNHSEYFVGHINDEDLISTPTMRIVDEFKEKSEYRFVMKGLYPRKGLKTKSFVDAILRHEKFRLENGL